MATQYFGTAAGTRLAATDWAAKQVAHLLRLGVTLVERTSGMPHDCAVAAPPESNADIEPTAAKVCAQAVA